MEKALADTVVEGADVDAEAVIPWQHLDLNPFRTLGEIETLGEEGHRSADPRLLIPDAQKALFKAMCDRVEQQISVLVVGSDDAGELRLVRHDLTLREHAVRCE